MATAGARPGAKQQSRDPVCGMVVVQEEAIGPEESEEGPVWFCSLGCQAQYQAQQAEKPREAGSIGAEA
jgi:hypothetical protein